MDFTNLVVAPVAGVATMLVIAIALLAGKYSKPKVPVLSLCIASVATTLLIQPWYYTSLNALFAGVATLILLTLFGFAVGALLILTPLKLLRR